MSSQPTAVVAVALLGLAAVACLPNRMYRVDSVDYVDHVDRTETSSPYSLAFVELDDQGELWAPAQLSSALDLIRAENKGPEGAIVFVFIHGLNHNASVGDSSVDGFRHVLQVIAAEERRANPDRPRPVVGVYLGWRGKTLLTPILRPFSFFNRRGAAMRIAGPAATEVIYRIAITAKENRPSKVVFMGHSYGGLILERAVTQAMVGAVLDAGQRRQRFPADAVVLLNPASQALHAKQFIETLSRNRIKLYRSDENGERYERPLVVSVTSEGDWATRFVFRAGLSFKSLAKNFRKYDNDNCTPLGRQSAFYRRTAGHSDVLLSHLVTARKRTVGSEAEVAGDRFGVVETVYDAATRQRVFSFFGEEHIFTIKRRPRALNASPYWIMRVPVELIPDHTTVFGSDTVRLIGALLAITGALERDSSTVLVQEKGLRPIDIVMRPSGDPIVLDRDRRVYLIDGDEEPRSPGCIPQAVDAADRIALAFDRRGGHAVINRPAKSGAATRFRTEVLDIEMTEGGPRIAGTTRLEGDTRFIAAAFDFARDRLFLASQTAGEIFVADLQRPKSPPRLLIRHPDCGPLSVLAFDSERDRLLAADGRQGSLFAVELAGERAVPKILVEGLGWPIDLDVDASGSVVYVVDAKRATVWRTRCLGADTCEPPEPFLEPGLLQQPSLVSVGPDGTVWVAGLEDGRVLSLEPTGRVKRTIES